MADELPANFEIQSLILFMMLCCACRNTTLGYTQRGSTQWLTKTDVDIYRKILDGGQRPLERVRGKNEGPQGDRNFIGRSRMSTTLDPRKFPETEPSSRESAQADMMPPAHTMHCT